VGSNVQHIERAAAAREKSGYPCEQQENDTDQAE
jgi:hypothetical protein